MTLHELFQYKYNEKIHKQDKKRGEALDNANPMSWRYRVGVSLIAVLLCCETCPEYSINHLNLYQQEVMDIIEKIWSLVILSSLD